MGIGSSRERYNSGAGRRSPASKHRRQGGNRRRSGLLRKIRPASTPVIPVRYRSPYQYSYGLRPDIPPIAAYAPLSRQPIYPGYMPISYNNYAAPPYVSPSQPIMIPPQQFQPMVIPQSQLIMTPHAQPMSIPQQVSPRMFSPYISSPYSMGIPLSTPYPQVQPVYNNIGVSAPVFTGMAGSTGPYSFPYQATYTKFSTDWTGGGKISPGFLGPPI